MVDQPERIPMGSIGMNPAAMHAMSRLPATERPNPVAPRLAEQAALAQRGGIGSVPPRKKGGRT
jgi:hypothetical protein